MRVVGDGSCRDASRRYHVQNDIRNLFINKIRKQLDKAKLVIFVPA